MRKRLLMVLLLLVAVLLAAEPALAYRYYYYDVDDTDQIELLELLEAWYRAREDGDANYELDIGDLIASGELDDEELGTIASPTVPGAKPLRSYIVSPDNEVRTLNILVSNEPEDIYPPEAVDSIVGKDLDEVVENFQKVAELFEQATKDSEQMKSFETRYDAQLDVIYDAFEAYMLGAGFEGQYSTTKEEMSKILYIVANYFEVGSELLTALDDTVNPGRYAFLGTEIFKGILATFLDDEVSMEEFLSVMYLWQAPGKVEGSIDGSPYAYAKYDYETKEWVIVDIFQLMIVGDSLSSDEVWDVMMDTREFVGEDVDVPIMALHYDQVSKQWKIAGINTAGFEILIGAV